MRTTPRRLALPLLAALLTAGACGDGGDAAPSTTTISPEARARAVNLRLEDLPAEFVAVPQQGEGAGEGGVGDCVPGFEEAMVAEAQTPLFERPTESGLQFLVSRTAVFDDEAAASGVLEAVQQPTTVDCLRTNAAGQLIDTSSGAAVQDTGLQEAADVPALGEESTALTGSVTFTTPASDQPVGLTYTLVLLRTDSVVSLLIFGGVSDAFPPETVVELSTVVAERQGAG